MKKVADIMKKVADIMILSPTSLISRQHKVTNISMPLKNEKKVYFEIFRISSESRLKSANAMKNWCKKIEN